MSYIAVKLGQHENAASSFEKALELARHQNDSAAEDAISKALEEINNKIVQGVKADGDEGEKTL